MRNFRAGSKADITAPEAAMSALPPKADIGQRNRDVRFVPNSDMPPKSATVLQPNLAQVKRGKIKQRSSTPKRFVLG
jgi:hypothetical protein